MRALRKYIAERNPSAAESTARRILDCVEQLVMFPASGRAGRKPNTRELVVSGTPYLIFYRVEDEVVEILRVIHGARKWP
jgi:toxin ParE1/3/4